MPTTPAPLLRTESRARMAGATFDVLVIGGGITGAGVALDAASRGLSTALVERDDFASGTSSRSSKLIHGGLRYLQQGDVRLVYEALRERRRLRHNAPHLVRVLPFMIPILTKDGLISRKIARALGTAMWLYDVTGGWRIGKLHRRLRAKAALGHLPTMPAERLASAYLYYDAEADDARLCLSVVRTAADHGAVVLNAAEVVGIGTAAEGLRRVTVHDAIDGTDFVVDARVVVNATGVWADDVRALDEGGNPDSIRPAKGVHVTIPWDKIRNDIAVVLPVPGDKRSLFVIPWVPDGAGGFRYTYIGTTDTDHHGSIDEPLCSLDDLDYVLRAVNASLTTNISRDDVTAVWAGLRPLVKPDAGVTVSKRTADLSRRHRVGVSDNGVVTVTGGKLTTYREMAEDTVDEVMRLLRRRSRCRTRRLRLHGAGHIRSTGNTDRHLIDRYGTDAVRLREMIDAEPMLAAPLIDGLPYLAVEAVYAVTDEMAVTLDDVLSRRTRARLLDRRATVRAADTVARLIAPRVGWTDERITAEVVAFVESCAREEAALHTTEDELSVVSASADERKRR